MLSLGTVKLIYALVIFIVTIVSGIRPLLARITNNYSQQFHLGESFARGVFLGAALFHMLPEAMKAFQTLRPNDSYPFATLLCALGFVILLFLEKVVLVFSAKKHALQTTVIAYLLTMILAFHAYVTGAALGMNTEFAAALIIFIAIIAHKGSESFSLAATLHRSALSTQAVLVTFFLFSLVTPLGIATGTLIADSLTSYTGMLWAASFNALAAGTFLYIATLHKHEDSESQSVQLYEFIFLVVGLLIMAAVAIWL